MIGTTVSHYRITGTLGRGGMGVVYEAQDERLGRQVAIKFLPETVRDPKAIQRFRREAQATSSLNHPNICTLHDIGEHEGRPFLVMERMHGRTLKEHIGGKPLSVEDIVRLAHQIADALESAHRAGVVHRDLKPTNIFITDRGDAKLLDFGLVKMVETSVGLQPEALGTEDDATATGPLTHPGSAMGTAPYMSPEQARGAPLDHRTDLYSLGAVLYEMATGIAPHSGGNNVEILYSVLHHEPAPPSERNPELPEFLEQFIVRLLAKAPPDRYQTAADLRADLAPYVRASTTGISVDMVSAMQVRRRRTVWKTAVPGALLVVVAAAVLGWVSRSDEPAVEAGPKTHRIAVLPFDILGPTEDAYLAVGISEEVRSRLTAVDGLAVIASSSARQYAGTDKPPETIAAELGVRYLLSGTVQWQQNDGTGRVRVTPELVEVTRSGAPTIRWQDTFDAPLEDLFRVQTRVANRVSQALDLALAPEPIEAFSEPPTADLDAYDAYLRGQDIWGRQGAIDPISLRDAALHFERAVALDPEFAEAWVELARISAYLYSVVDPSPSTRDTAKRSALRAAELEPDRIGTHLAMGDFHAHVAGDFLTAQQHYEQGLAINPRDAELLSAAGFAKVSLGRWEDALQDLRLARDLDPRSALPAYRLGFTLLCLRRYIEADEAYTRGLAAVPTDLNLLEGHAMVFLAQGDLDGARAIIAEPDVDRTALVAYIGTYWGLYWLLDEEQQDLLLRLSPAAFGGNRAYWGLILASTARYQGDTAQTLHFAHEADRAFAPMIAAAPQDAQLNVLNGLNQAMLGRRDEALAAANRAGELSTIDNNALFGAFIQHTRAKIHFMVGDVDGGFDLLEPLLEIPYFLSPGWIRIDPDFDRLRDHPRYRRLVGDAS
jgi:TolB-like protein/Flp pilus assembly protein TadD